MPRAGAVDDANPDPPALDDAGSSNEPASRDDALARAVAEWPGLAAVVEAWPTLPEAIRRAIVALVEASSNVNSGRD